MTDDLEAPHYALYPSLRQRKVLITGGATGIGASIVLHFAAQGSQVAFFDIQDEAAAQLVAVCEERGYTSPLYVRCDLTDTAGCRDAVASVLERFGGLDVLVNNGANDQRHATEDVSPELWDELMAINLRHQFFVTQAALPALKKSQGASVINMSSISWMIPSTRQAVYIAAKAAIVGLTRTLAHEVGEDGVRVNCVLPGAILTERQKRLWMTREYSAKVLASQALKRHLVPEEVARLVLFLAAADSSAMTGQSYIIDGGWV